MQTLSISSSMACSSSASSHSSSSLRWRVRASWDTQQLLSYNPNAPRKLKKSAAVTTANPPPPPVPLSPSAAKMVETVSHLLARQNPPPVEKPEEKDDSYLGCDRWLPSPPKVEKPRSIFNAASLAYLGDCIYELYARRHFLFPPLSIEEYNDRVTAVVRCEAQDALLQKLLNENYFTQQERELLRWGKNVVSSKSRTKKRAGTAVYNRASSLETLIGFLYLKNMKRLEEVMQKIGFSTDSSSIQFMLEEVNGKSTKVPRNITQPRVS